MKMIAAGLMLLASGYGFADTLAPVEATAKRITVTLPEMGNYPMYAQHRRLRGTVVVRAEIDRDGKAQKVSVLRSSGSPTLDRAAVLTVKRSQFKLHVDDASLAQVDVPMTFSAPSYAPGY